MFLFEDKLDDRRVVFPGKPIITTEGVIPDFLDETFESVDFTDTIRK